jgi:hypothetical protein
MMFPVLLALAAAPPLFAAMLALTFLTWQPKRNLVRHVGFGLPVRLRQEKSRLRLPQPAV